MKTNKLIILSCLVMLGITQISCKKDEIEPTTEVPKFYLPATIQVQNSSTAASIFTATFSYNADSSISKIEQVSSGNTLDWTFDYNPNGTLNTVVHTNRTGSSYNYTFSLSYDVNNKLARVIQNGTPQDTTNYTYMPGSNTYVGAGGEHDGLRFELNTAGQLDNMQDWQGAHDINLTYQSSEKGVFTNVKMDESVLVFLNIYHFHHLTHSFFHSQQVSSAVWVDGTYTWQNYNRDDNGYISTFQTLRNSNLWQNYTVTYNEK